MGSPRLRQILQAPVFGKQWHGRPHPTTALNDTLYSWFIRAESVDAVMAGVKCSRSSTSEAGHKTN